MGTYVRKKDAERASQTNIRQIEENILNFFPNYSPTSPSTYCPCDLDPPRLQSYSSWKALKPLHSIFKSSFRVVYELKESYCRSSTEEREVNSFVCNLLSLVHAACFYVFRSLLCGVSQDFKLFYSVLHKTSVHLCCLGVRRFDTSASSQVKDGGCITHRP